MGLEVGIICVARGSGPATGPEWPDLSGLSAASGWPGVPGKCLLLIILCLLPPPPPLSSSLLTFSSFPLSLLPLSFSFLPSSFSIDFMNIL